jgi:hypothetical protein
VRAWLLVIAWAAVIFAFSSVPNLSMLRKLAHAAEFAVLGALLVRAPGREGPAWTLGVLYSASDELRRRVVAAATRRRSTSSSTLPTWGSACS